MSIDGEGVVVSWNEQAERTFGWPPQDAIGHHVAELIIPPELRAAHREGMKRFLATGEAPAVGRRVQFPALHRNGRRFPVELAVWGIFEDGAWTFNAIVQDVTGRHEREEASRRLASIVDAFDDAIISVAPDETIVTWNSAAGQMYGFEPEEAVGQPIWLIVPPHGHDEMSSWLAMAREGKQVRYRETTRLTRTGSTLEVAESIVAIRDADGQLVGVSVIDRDVTEHRWMASTLDAVLENLEGALSEAQTSEARSRRFLADAAHQLRTPITGIRVCAENLLHGGERAEQDRLLGDLVRETVRASRLVTSLLRIARLDEGEALPRAPTDLVRLCADEVDRAWSLSPHLDFRLRGDASAAAEPYLDANSIREILGNLLDNARQHASERVEVVVEALDGAVEVHVRDDGPGVPEGMEERIFERFVSLGETGGSGLGLAIARELARAHGGELSYGPPGFTLHLPTT